MVVWAWPGPEEGEYGRAGVGSTLCTMALVLRVQIALAGHIVVSVSVDCAAR